MTDPIQPDMNPYAAPLADAELVTHTEQHYGLEEPICLEGTLTLETALRGNQAIRLQVTRGLHVTVMVIVAVACNWALATVEIPRLPPYSAAVLVGVALLGLYFYLVLIVGPRHTRHQLEQVVGEGMWVRYCFTEDDFIAVQTHAEVRDRWSMFASYEVTDEFLLLRFQGDDNDGHLVPRSFCANESDWRTIEGLVACKLPLREVGKIPVTRPIAQQSLEAAVIAADAMPGDSAATIVAAGHLSLGDLRYVNRVMHSTFWNRYGLAAFGAIFAGLALLSGIASDSPWAATPFAFLAGSVALTWIIAIRRVRTLSRNLEGFFSRQEWRITEQDLTLIQPGYSLTAKWGHFLHYHTSADRIVLESGGGRFYTFPRRFFGREEDWNLFTQRVRTHLEKRSS